MARFTVQDCMEHINNRFDMTLVAITRAKQIEQDGHSLLSNHNRDKVTVLALREIAAGLVDKSVLKNLNNE